MADTIIGVFSPHRFGLREYLGYNISKWQDNIRFMEIIAGREGGGGSICPLYFDGGVNFFAELPKPEDSSQIKAALELAEKYRTNKIFLFMYKKKERR